ncbi:hypothetical protein WN55_10661 [Dufourea novaeangliae]|uniref:Uncharacterized protein n=1 Tax=Dufourea novaeangliae TaxID=178035 RepID=A0A154P9E4_DUFNO|nr:hypothetical protein WN55_10661 [Dufourea novaeangliae]
MQTNEFCRAGISCAFPKYTEPCQEIHTSGFIRSDTLWLAAGENRLSDIVGPL